VDASDKAPAISLLLMTREELLAALDAGEFESVIGTAETAQIDLQEEPV
jgi:hypothetical protein